MHNPLNDTIIASIKDNHLHPRPRWQFVARNTLFWCTTILMTLLGSVAIAVGLFILTDHDWDIFMYLDKSRLVYTLEVLPYVWGVILIISSIIGRYTVARTRTGYRYRVRTSIGISIATSALLGGLLYIAGFGTVIHEKLSGQIPWYKQLIYTKRNVWYTPDKGLLSGDIVSITDTAITITARDGTMWIITALPEVRELPVLTPGVRIKLIGEQTGTHSFNAEDIALWNE